MKTEILFIVCSFVAGGTLYAHSPTPTVSATVAHTVFSDSVGTEFKNGKQYVLHRVDQGQTLYAIARRYGRSVSAIQAANPGMGNTVRYDQLVRIPIADRAKPAEATTRKPERTTETATASPPKPEQSATTASGKTAPLPSARQSNNEARKSDDPARAGIHIVEPRQTLYSLAMQYGVSQTDLRKWNNLPSNSVLIGQALIVSEKAYVDRLPTSAMPARPVDVPTSKSATTRPTDTRSTETKPTDVRPTATRPEPKPDKPAVKRPAEVKPTEVTPTDTKSGATTKPVDPAVPVESPRPGNDAPMPTYGRRIVVSGVAEMIDGVDGSGKYLALHRTAPIGTLVQVRNAFNSQSLWVKVIGRLPNTGVNDKILIKLSSQAFAKLSPEDRRFRAEVSYIVK